MILPERAFCSLPLRVLSAVFAPLELGELVQDTVHQLALGGVVAPVVEGTHLSFVLLELAPQQVMVGGLAREPVPVLGEHHGEAAGGHEVAHAVHAGPLQARPALAGVGHLLHYLVALTGSVGPQRLHLLGEGVAGAGLLVGGDAGVEDGVGGGRVRSC